MDFHVISILTQRRIKILCFSEEERNWFTVIMRSKSGPKSVDEQSPMIFQHFCIFQHYQHNLRVLNGLLIG